MSYPQIVRVNEIVRYSVNVVELLLYPFYTADVSLISWISFVVMFAVVVPTPNGSMRGAISPDLGFVRNSIAQGSSKLDVLPCGSD